MLSLPAAYALTAGPSQPEVQGFQPAGTSDMVDLFTGDFSYNIPLFELPGPNGGYPFNLSYQAGIGMDQEASWVGLGFSLNPGAINRQMRGLPDEFKGDQVKTKMSIDPSVTVGLGAGVGTEILGGDGSLGVGFGVSQNNYKGFGYNIDASIGFEKTASSGRTAGASLGVSLNSKEGVGVNPSLSLGGKMGDFGLGAGYNSKSGLENVSMNYNPKIKGYKLASGSTAAMGTTLSLTSPGYTPQVSMPMKNINLAAKFKAGVAWWGLFNSANISGFYNEQWLKNDKKTVPTSAYGYLHYQEANNANDMLDINREKDGIVSKESPNLAIPSLTYDIYSVTGQGIGAMYRPLRNDYGIVWDPETSSSSTGGSAGVDVGPVASHIGVNLSINHSKSTSGQWDGNNNDIASRARFQGRNLNDAYEPWYFKAHGEPSSESVASLEALGGNKPVRVQLDGLNINPKASSILEEGKVWSSKIPDISTANRERKSRSQVIQPITNEQLVQANQELIPYFRVDYIDHAGVEKAYNRSSQKLHHTAGFTALTAEGLRYNYAIPAYNLYQEEVIFSANKTSNDTTKVAVGNNGAGDPEYGHKHTEKYLKKTEMPPYAHSYLLTSIIGPDYVDVTGDGVTVDDLGYWVKFTYKKTTADGAAFKWRDPFSKAHFQEGWKSNPADDKGSFVYGEKELWYLAKAETKSHIASFTIQEREDGKGVATKLQDNNERGGSVYALKEIKLFTRSAGNTHPIKVVKFEHDYSLCKGIPNSSTKQGKLTLKKLWFEYGNSKRGRLNPYVFTYHSKNPNYDQLAYDRWGNFKSYPKKVYLHNIDFPYVEQDPQNKQELDDNAAAWSMKEIALPSGGKVIIDYEIDDYGYVQHLAAMQMTKLVDPYSDAAQASLATKFTLKSNNLKIRFPLEQPISGSLTADQKRAEVLKYLDQRRMQLYFKIKVNLRSSSEDFFEYISGYANIDEDNSPEKMGLETDGTGKYIYGYFHLLPEDGHHPFAIRAWQHLRTNQPELANSERKLDLKQTNNNLKQTNNNNERVRQIKRLGSVVTQLRQMFNGFYAFCNREGWGRDVEVGKSWIRLNSPDKIKYGGGLRVRQITMKDAWSHDEEGIYGQIYEYTTEEKGKVISSGVAAYEPLVGGDENPHRYAKKYVQAVPLRSDNNLFFEYPINESYYPGPQIGYRKVTVTSIAAASLAGKEVKNITLSDGKKLLPQGQGISYGTTGKTVHEFYTAKEFPVITDETEKANKPYKLSVLIPFLGNISVSKLTASQGYSITTNDMHGKQKQVSNYRQDPTGKFEAQPISWVKYNYLQKSKIYQKEPVFTVSNIFKNNGDGTLSVANGAELKNTAIEKYSLGQENEFIMDMRQFEDNAWSGGASFNTDIIYIPLLFIVVPIPVMTVWPSIGKSTTQLRTAATNKVMFKGGILESVEAYDGGSRVLTQNLKWDKITGNVVLTKVNNNFDEPIYSYQIPAYSQYQGMGAAYQNIGLTFAINSVGASTYKQHYYKFATSLAEANLQPGDEILLYTNSELKRPVARVVYIGLEDGKKILYSETILSETDYKCMIVRSGYRNQLNVMAGSITALKDPSQQGETRSYQTTIKVPVVK